MTPIEAGTMLAPLFVVMDLYALRYWKPTTWSKPDLSVLIPGLVAGIAVGSSFSRGSIAGPSRSRWPRRR